MTSVDEYIKMAEEDAGDNAHVAALTHYRDAIEGMRYSPSAAPYLLAAVQYAAQQLKKKGDREAIADWGTRALEKIRPDATLEATINQEIAKLKAGGKENATT